jgi:hypothetical protein
MMTSELQAPSSKPQAPTPAPAPAAAAAAKAKAKAKPGVIALELPEHFLKNAASKFPEGVNVLVVAPEDFRPEFIRLPTAGEKCTVTGLPRSTLMDLLKAAGRKVPVRQLRQPGATTGVCLIPRQALVDYINEQPGPPWQGEGGEFLNH